MSRKHTTRPAAAKRLRVAKVAKVATVAAPEPIDPQLHALLKTAVADAQRLQGELALAQGNVTFVQRQIEVRHNLAAADQIHVDTGLIVRV